MTRIYQLGRHQCRWPGDMVGGWRQFCAAPVDPGSSYCPEHHARAFDRVLRPYLSDFIPPEAFAGYAAPTPVPPEQRLDVNVADWIDMEIITNDRCTDED